MENNGKTLIILLVAAILIALGAYLFVNLDGRDGESVREDIDDSFTNETDGTGNQNDDEWRFATTPDYTFQYPADPGLEYVELTDWPPMVELTTDVFVCTEAGTETDRAGRTEQVTMGDRQYCRTIIVEGAAGSTYTQYAYAFPRDEGTAIMTFSTRTPTCGNFAGNEVAACEAEVEGFEVDDLADRMARTFNTVNEDE